MSYLRIMLFIFVLFTFMATPSIAEDYLGEKECMACHKEMKEVYIKGSHGRVISKSPRTQAEAKGCEACHGPGKEHKAAVDNDEKDLKIESFRKGKGVPAERSAVCLACHEKGKVGFWQGERPRYGRGRLHKLP